MKKYAAGPSLSLLHIPGSAGPHFPVALLEVDHVALLHDGGKVLCTLGKVTASLYGRPGLKQSSLALEADLTHVVGGARLDTPVLLPLTLPGEECRPLCPRGGGAVALLDPAGGSGPPGPGVRPLGHQNGGL